MFISIQSRNNAATINIETSNAGVKASVVYNNHRSVQAIEAYETQEGNLLARCEGEEYFFISKDGKLLSFASDETWDWATECWETPLLPCSLTVSIPTTTTPVVFKKRCHMEGGYTIYKDGKIVVSDSGSCRYPAQYFAGHSTLKEELGEWTIEVPAFFESEIEEAKLRALKTAMPSISGWVRYHCATRSGHGRSYDRLSYTMDIFIQNGVVVKQQYTHYDSNSSETVELHTAIADDKILCEVHYVSGYQDRSSWGDFFGCDYGNSVVSEYVENLLFK